MKRAWQSFKAFWSAEEVPRWFGFSLVVVYLFGLATVARFGIDQAQSEMQTLYESSARVMARALASRMSTIRRYSISESEALIACRGELNDFAAHFPVRWLRIVDDERRVVMSTRPSEVGDVVETIGPPPENVEVTSLRSFEDGMNDIIVRAVIGHSHGWPSIGKAGDGVRDSKTGGSAREDASDGAGTTLYLEGRLLLASPSSNLADQASTLMAVLVVFGALFGLFRRLRAQLRGMSRIAGRLTSRHERIEEDLTALRIPDVDDKITSAWNQLVDFTQDLREAANRHEANEELSRVLQRSSGGALAEALHAFPDGIVHVVDEERFDYINTTACRLFGWSQEEVKDFTVSEAKSTGVGAKSLELLREARTAEGRFEPRATTVHAEEDDTVDQSSYRIWVVPTHQAQRRGDCLVIIRDVSQQARAERAREDFVTQVTHELRTPLTNIRAYAETLSSGMFDDPKVITECYNVITKETRRLSRLIEDILSVSQLEVGSIELHVDDVDLRTLLEEGVRDIRGLADEKKIDIQLILPSKMEPIRADRDKLAVIVNNLLGNAIKYTPRDGDVQVGCQYTGDNVVLTFKDNGIGIDTEDLRRVFEKFQRGSNQEVQSEIGSGIGLFTAREIARRHGGDIELISKLGEGSTFLVRIPHIETRAAALTSAEEA